MIAFSKYNKQASYNKNLQLKSKRENIGTKVYLAHYHRFVYKYTSTSKSEVSVPLIKY